MKNIWVYVLETRTFKRFREDNPRLIKGWPYAPVGHMKLITRGKSDYVPYGDTPQEAAANANRYVLVRIHELEAELVALKSRLVAPPW